MTEEAVPSPKKSKKAALTPDFCEIDSCTWEHKIQRHRIVPGRDGGKYRAGNVVALCPNHHWLADNAILGTEELLEIVRSRYENGWNGWPPVVDEQSQEQQNAPTGTDGTPQCGGGSAEEPASGDGSSAPDAVVGEEGHASE